MRTGLLISWMINLIVAWYHTANTVSAEHPLWAFVAVFASVGFLGFAISCITKESEKS